MILRRVLSSVPVVVEAALLALLVTLLITAFDPEFRGGWFVRSTLLIALGLVVAILVRDIMRAARGEAIEPESSTVVVMQVEEEPAAPVGWRTIAMVLATTVALFVAFLVFGIVRGITITSWVIMVWKLRVSAHRALFGAVILGIVVPVPFAYVLSLNLWPGAIPQIVPDWVGGGLIPPW